MMTARPRSTLFHRLGGPVVIRQIIDDFYRRLLDDPDLAQHFVGADLRTLRRHQFELLAVALGGAGSESARLPASSPTGLSAAHADLDGALAHLADALEAFGTDHETTDDLLGALRELEPAVVTA